VLDSDVQDCIVGMELLQPHCLAISPNSAFLLALHQVVCVHPNPRSASTGQTSSRSLNHYLPAELRCRGTVSVHTKLQTYLLTYLLICEAKHQLQIFFKMQHICLQ